MAALVVVVLLVVVGGLVLATSGGDDAVELTDAQRTDALITGSDVGAGFEETDSDDSGAPESLEASSACEEVLDRLDEDGTNPFGNEDDPPGLVERSLVNDENVNVEEGLLPTIDLVGIYREMAGACEDLDIVDDDTTFTVTLSEGDDPEIGDDSIRVDAEFTVEVPDSDPIDFNGSIIAWTRDGTDGLISFTDGFDIETGEPIALEEDLITDALARADERLAEVIDEA